MTLRNGLTPAERELLFNAASSKPNDVERASFGQEFAKEHGLDPAVVMDQISLVRSSVDRVLNAIIEDAKRRSQAMTALKNGNVQQAISFFAEANATKELLVIGMEYETRQPRVALGAFELTQDRAGILRILHQALKNEDMPLAMEALRAAQNIEASVGR